MRLESAEAIQEERTLEQRPDSPILPPSRQLYYAMAGFLEEEPKKTERKNPILQITSQGQTPLYEKLSLTAAAYKDLRRANRPRKLGEIVPTQSTTTSFIGAVSGGAALNHFERNHLINKMTLISSQMARREGAAHIIPQKGFTAARLDFSSKSEKQRYYRAVKQLEKLTTQLQEARDAYQQYDLTRAFIGIHTQFKSSYDEVSRLIHKIQSSPDIRAELGASQSLRDFIIEAICPLPTLQERPEENGELKQDYKFKKRSTLKRPLYKKSMGDVVLQTEQAEGSMRRGWMPRQDSCRNIPQLVKESQELEEMLVEYLRRAKLNETAEQTLPDYMQAVDRRRELRLRGSRSESSLGIKVSTYQAKVQRAQAEALEMRKEMMAQKVLGGIDTEKKRLTLEHVMLERALNKNATLREAGRMLKQPLVAPDD